MAMPDWRSVELNPGVLREPTVDGNHVVLWLPREKDAESQHWQRISNVPGAPITTADGICAMPATSLPARQPTLGLFAKVLQLFRKTSGGPAWLLPSGGSAEQSGDRRTDLMLLWPADETPSLEEAQIRSRFPTAEAVEKVGQNLFLITGVQAGLKRQEGTPTASREAGPTLAAPPAAVPPAAEPATAVPAAVPAAAVPPAAVSLPPEPPDPPRAVTPPAVVPMQPRDEAEQLLTAARQSGDRHKEAVALTDLGISNMRSGEPSRAIGLLEQALTIARDLGDQAQEADVLENLGMAVLATGLPARALEFLEQALGHARTTGNRFGQKIVLESLGRAYSAMRDPIQALACYDEALTLAREVGDYQQEADLLWYQAVEYAELGQREHVFTTAQAAIALFQSRGKPQAGFLADQLQKYAASEASARLPPGGFGGVIVTGAWSQPSSGANSSGPGLLRMAISAVKSAAKFLGSGLKTVPAATQQQRLGTCQTCEHHTGMRCKLCGCFTTVKAWLPHEDCPIGKWPAP
jgi:tetratricopeptide (TPR) repeat protein